jgi:anti-sigma factor RsiW
VNDHLSDDLLQRFAEGLLDERQATAAAVHIDECPRCAARALALEPLGPVFAACPDTQLPKGFEQAVLDALARPAPPFERDPLPLHRARPALAPSPGLLGIGAGLIAIAAALMLIGGEPTAMVWRLASVLRAALVSVGILLHNLPSPALSLALGASLALAGILTALRLIGSIRETA